KQKNEIEKITGIYAPFWLFDTRANGNLQGEATRVRSWTQGKYRYTETKHYEVMRSGHTRYDNIPVDASKKLDDGLMLLIEPYDYSGMTPFSMQYMSGFMAEKYDVEALEAEKIMEKRADSYMEARLRDTINGYTSFVPRGRQFDIESTTQEYAMFPIYLLINKFKGKDHAFIVNGQTGKVVGDTPISGLRQLVFGAAVFAGVWIIAVFGGALFG
ncbi:MAG: DNA helicase PriA, partial [Vallitaleaceae bacterium]|nr:DNA helicase PriA [Vallitaleaceae bacterium]